MSGGGGHSKARPTDRPETSSASSVRRLVLMARNALVPASSKDDLTCLKHLNYVLIYSV